MTAGSDSTELTEQTFTIAPFPAASMAGSVLRVARTAVIRLRLSVASQSWSVMARNPPVRAGAPPTLLTRMSILSPACATRAAGPPGSARSSSMAVTAPPAASPPSSAEECSAPAITRAPAPASARVTASPMPRLAPVTTAVCPVRSMFIMQHTVCAPSRHRPRSSDCAIMDAMPETMMALRAHARGGAEQLVYEPAPVPVPRSGEALVAVHAAAITFEELTWDESWTTRDGRDRTPVIPSHEVSGTVAALGPGADGVTVGEEVYGLIDFDRDGAAAEYVTVPAAHLAARPRSVSDEQAASLPLAALTAWQALVDHAALKPGEQVLVQGGAGGVGNYVVQLAAILGGIVTATGHARQRDFVLGLGATSFLELDAVPPDSFDVVIDTVGGAVLDASYAPT